MSALTDTKTYKSEDANFPSRSSAAKEISLCSQQRLLKAAVKGIRRRPTKEDVQAFAPTSSLSNRNIWNCFSISICSIWNGILLPKSFWPAVRNNCSSDREKNFEIRGRRPRICKNSERSEQFLITECFFRFLRWYKL